MVFEPRCRSTYLVLEVEVCGRVAGEGLFEEDLVVWNVLPVVEERGLRHGHIRGNENTLLGSVYQRHDVA